MNRDEISGRLQAFCDHVYDDSVRVRDLHSMEDGHAGLTFGFRVDGSDGIERESLVLRLCTDGLVKKADSGGTSSGWASCTAWAALLRQQCF